MQRYAKKVAIIGSGQSGIVAAKYAVENGLSPTVFDKAKTQGGNWACSNESTCLWDKMYSNLSFYSMSYSDHFYPKNSTLFPSKQDVHDYLHSYIKRFQLEHLFRLETKVEKAIQLLNKNWQIETVDMKTNSKSTEEFDFLMVASGLHLNPRIPKFENQENFKGTIMHSSQFALDDPKLKSKRVLVVGCCHSGAEISSNLVGHASNVTNIFRRPYLFTRRFIRYKSDQCGKNSFLIKPIDMVVNSRAFRPPNSLSKEEKTEYYLRNMSLLNPEQTDKNKSVPVLYFDLKKEVPRVTISDNYYGFVKQGKIKAKKTFIERFEDDGVVLNDGSFEKADIVMFCTGYGTNTDYFDEKTQKTLGSSDSDHYKFQRLLYKCTFHPSIPNMAMMFQNEGFTINSSELQSRWVTSIFSGKKQLPDKQKMLDHINKIQKKRDLKLEAQYPHGTQADMNDMFANEFGIQHDFDHVKQNDPELFKKIWYENPGACQWNLSSNETHEILNDLQRLTSKTYEFKDDDANAEISIREIAETFNKNQPENQVPLHLFRA